MVASFASDTPSLARRFLCTLTLRVRSRGLFTKRDLCFVGLLLLLGMTVSSAVVSCDNTEQARQSQDAGRGGITRDSAGPRSPTSPNKSGSAGASLSLLPPGGEGEPPGEPRAESSMAYYRNGTGACLPDTGTLASRSQRWFPPSCMRVPPGPDESRCCLAESSPRMSSEPALSEYAAKGRSEAMPMRQHPRLCRPTPPPRCTLPG